MSDVSRRASAEIIPTSNRSYPLLDRPIAIDDSIPFKFAPLDTLPKVLLVYANSGNRVFDERQSPL